MPADTPCFSAYELQQRRGNPFEDYDLPRDDIMNLNEKLNRGYRVSVGDGIVSSEALKYIRIVETGRRILSKFASYYPPQRIFSEGRNVTNTGTLIGYA